MKVAELFASLGLKVDRKSWSVGNDVIAGLGKALAVFVGYRLVTGLAGVVKEVSDLGGRLNDVSKQTGVSAESLQELGFAAEQSGSSFEGVVGAAKRLGKGLSDAMKTGKGPVVEALGKMGISVGSLRKKMAGQGGFDDILNTLATKFQGMPEGPQKTALAMDLFGKSGAELIPLLNEGAEGLDKFRKRANELGVVLSNEDVQKLDDFGDSMGEVKSAWQGIKNQAVIALLPALKELVTNLLAWITANREMIKQKLASFIGGLATAMKILGTAIAFVVDHWEFFAAALAGTAVVTGIIRLIKFIEWLKLASTAAAAKTALAWLVAAAPFVLMAAAIGALVLLVLKYKKQAREAFNWIVGQLVGILNWITSLPGRAIGALLSLGNMIKTKIGEAWEWVKQKAEETWDYIMSIPGRIKDWAADKVGFGDDSSMLSAVRAPITPGQGGYLMPSRKAGPSVTITNGPMTVMVPPGGNPADYEAAVRKGVQDEWANQMNHAYSDAGED